MMSSRSSPRSGFGAVALIVAVSLVRRASAEPESPRDPAERPADTTRPTEPQERATEPRDRATEPRERSTELQERSTEPQERSTEPQERSTEPQERESEPARGRSPASTNEPEVARDEVKLRDGRRVRGRIVQKQPGRWVIIATDDGVQRTVAWDRVEEIAVAPATQKASATDGARAAWQTRTSAGLTYELRVAITGIMLPTRKFELSGECATGTGLAPASMYGQFATDSGRAAGGGVGARLGYMYISRIEPDGASTWWSLRAGGGLDLQVLHSQLPVGLDEIKGELCSRVVRSRHEVVTRSSTLVLAHVPLTFGAQLGLGGFDEDMTWRGVVLGAAWAPSYVQIWPWVGDASSHVNPLGLELSVDLAALHATKKKRAPEPQLRFSLYLAPSLDASQPTIGMLGFGPTWY